MPKQEQMPSSEEQAEIEKERLAQEKAREEARGMSDGKLREAIDYLEDKRSFMLGDREDQLAPLYEELRRRESEKK